MDHLATRRCGGSRSLRWSSHQGDVLGGHLADFVDLVAELFARDLDGRARPPWSRDRRRRRLGVFASSRMAGSAETGAVRLGMTSSSATEESSGGQAPASQFTSQTDQLRSMSCWLRLARQWGAHQVELGPGTQG